ncbi:hypothetical protein NP233_g7993 [Leucocoprinus birnbaumii]|uniref:Nephrocystin 3-like N-terminal domain-containing protein n=1 Tax=Leucocoprinus birnbaumii TaxID=56174 RepID=A0AAD5VN49_9AGAR|nr:hypothetical protein NP233_g7993 [Leucocoprinus birnbaumii]
MFANASNTVIHSPVIIDNTQLNITNGAPERDVERKGLEKLLDSSMPDAFYIAYARWPPPKCHQGTRQEVLKSVRDWGSNASNHEGPQSVLWLHGPFGVGKSAIAQTSAEEFASNDRLCASLFLSRPNNRSNPNRIFTSIAYQISTRSRPFALIVNEKIQNDPSILGTDLRVQFQELIERPLRKVSCEGLTGCVIILDALDECDGVDAQREILEIVTTSVRERTTPFRWGSQSPWGALAFPSDVDAIVMGAAGLFIYAATAARFINERDSLGPEHQLRTVLDHIRKNRATTESARTNPFARMDQLYMLIMQRVPPNVMPTLQRILLLNWAYIDPVYDNVLELANVLELSEAQFCTACGFLQSVLCLGNSSHHRLSAGMSIKFYHASFMEFMEDQERSGDFCIYNCLTELQREIIERIQDAHTRSKDSSSVLAKITFPPQSPLPDGHTDMLIYSSLLESLIQLCQLDKRALEPSVAASLLGINFSMIPRLLNGSPFPAIFVKHQQMRRNLPRQFRDRILRRAWNPLIYLHKPNYAAPERPFIIGNGSNGLVCWHSKYYTSNVVQLVKGVYNKSYDFEELF